jgi:hypothetical protein
MLEQGLSGHVASLSLGVELEHGRLRIEIELTPASTEHRRLRIKIELTHSSTVAREGFRN